MGDLRARTLILVIHRPKVSGSSQEGPDSTLNLRSNQRNDNGREGLWEVCQGDEIGDGDSIFFFSQILLCS
jgi:hypothetical protein